MINWYRSSINPPYSRKDLPALIGTFFVLLIPLAITLLLVQFNYFEKTKPQKLQYREEADSFVFTSSGDFGANSDTEMVLEAIADSGSRFHLALGDLSYSQIKPEAAWCDFVKSKVGAAFPFQLVTGNHEDNGPDGDINKFAQCLPNKVKGLIGNYAKEYYFDYKYLARFILISPNLNLDGKSYDYNVGNPHYDWVVNAIDSARSANIPWVIVGMHKNCITMGAKTCEVGTDLINMLIEKRVDLILQGHEHNYQRSRQLKCASADSYKDYCVDGSGDNRSYVKGLGSILVIAGTSGRSLTNIDTADYEAGYFAKWSGKNINPSQGTLKFTVSRKQIFYQFVSISLGQFGDSFTISNNVPE